MLRYARARKISTEKSEAEVKFRRDFKVLLMYPNLSLMKIPSLAIALFTSILKSQGYDVSNYETGGVKFSVKAPDGNTYNFKDQSSLDKFKKEVGIQ